MFTAEVVNGYYVGCRMTHSVSHETTSKMGDCRKGSTYDVTGDTRRRGKRPIAGRTGGHPSTEDEQLIVVNGEIAAGPGYTVEDRSFFLCIHSFVQDRNDGKWKRLQARWNRKGRLRDENKIKGKGRRA